MSESINVEHAFNPEARQAQADMDAFVQTRPHNSVEAAVNATNHEAETMPEAYEDMSITSLAKKLGEAELNEDRTTAGDIEDALNNKLIVMAEQVAEKSKKQSVEDRALAQDNLFDRVMAIKDNHKADLTGGTPTPEADAPADEAVRAPRSVDLDDVARAIEDARDEAIVEGRDDIVDHADRLLDENEAAQNSAEVDEVEEEVTPTSELEAVEVEDEAPTPANAPGRLRRAWNWVRGGERNEDGERPNARRNAMIGAAALVGTGIVIGAGVIIGKKIGQDISESIKQTAELAMHKAQRTADTAREKAEVFKLMKGFKAVEDFSGLKPGEPGFDEAFKQASDLANKVS